MRLVKIIGVVCALCALGALFVYAVVGKSAGESLHGELAAGKRPALPKLNLKPLKAGQQCSLTAYKGKVTVVNFWASWCESCRHELDSLVAMRHQLTNNRVALVGVSTKDVSEDAAALVDKLKLSYTQCHDGDGRAARVFGVNALPETVIIDRQGRVAALQRGPVTQEWLTDHLERLAKEEV
jgi:peroxiredoxin